MGLALASSLSLCVLGPLWTLPASQPALHSSKSVLFKLSYDPIHGSCCEVSGLQRAFEMTHYKI